MDFVLGILVGVTATFIVVLCIGYRLNKTQKERGVPKARNPPAPPPKFDNLDQRTEDYRRKIMAAYGITPESLNTYRRYRIIGLTPEDMRFIRHSDELYIKTSLSQRLEEAIESENFEEAARIRDLINKG